MSADEARDESVRYRPLNEASPLPAAELERLARLPRHVPLKPGSEITLTWEQGVALARALHICARYHDGGEAAAAMRALPPDVLGHALTDDLQ